MICSVFSAEPLSAAETGLPAARPYPHTKSSRLDRSLCLLSTMGLWRRCARDGSRRVLTVEYCGCTWYNGVFWSRECRPTGNEKERLHK